MRAAEAAKHELEKAEKQATEQKRTDESARIPSYAGMYRRAEGSSKCASPKVNAPEFRIRDGLLEKRDRVGHDWRIVLPTEKAQHAVLHDAHHALSGHASHNAMLRDVTVVGGIGGKGCAKHVQSSSINASTASGSRVAHSGRSGRWQRWRSRSRWALPTASTS